MLNALPLIQLTTLLQRYYHNNIITSFYDKNENKKKQLTKLHEKPNTRDNELYVKHLAWGGENSMNSKATNIINIIRK